jgi:CDP-glycerol glycerophosphotransferase (TagB/SpsB family)
VLEALTEKYKDTPNILWDYNRENIYSLLKADIMISDFSGIIFDYTFLCNKPVIYVKQNMDLRPYDADDLGDNAINELWQFKVLDEIGIELKEEYFDNIDEVIKNASDNEGLKTARKNAKDIAWQHQGEAGKRVTDFMIEIVNSKTV